MLALRTAHAPRSLAHARDDTLFPAYTFRMRSILAISFFIAALPLLAQEKLVETIEVRVTNVDVVVTDRAGNPVHGLTRDDFELLENGKPQTITNFYEVKPEPTGATSIAATPSAPS